MKPAFFHRLVENRNLSRDKIGILLLFAIGVTGHLIVFMIPAPLQILAPQVPMLAPQDWPGSYIGEEKRGFYQSLYLSQDSVNAFIDQTLVWYANPDENVDRWNQLDPETYNGWPILERRMDTDQPVSYLACNPDLSCSPPQCWYLAYWGHWFTSVFFWRQSDEDLLRQDIHQLIPRIDQLLMSAPDELCFWFFCTSGIARRLQWLWCMNV